METTPVDDLTPHLPISPSPHFPTPPSLYRFPIPDSRFPIPDSRFPNSLNQGV
ncbi:hypothetical protein BJP36_43650 [Moorena producens JHB]|uniref:Uncharacterized protein n=1 Tax=Moorena producens (strain JHB) TaxID=1454205 RepID=A0A9Q9UVW5_MOOP1|nr:hypothetical protein [Moorena producens]WAN69258.1 hypothetical protein BJP36_43650 [Moorena producens JHB]